MSRKSRRKKKADFKGKLFLTFGILIALGLGYLLYQSNQRVVSREPNNMCRNDGFISRETAIIIDATDSFSDSQGIVIKQELKNILRHSLVDEKFSLYVLDGGANSSQVEDRIVVCNPGDGSDKSELTSNKRRLLNKWKDGFFNRFNKEVDKLVGEHTSDSSPILEMLKMASVKSMYSSGANEKRIIMVSDMLHHTIQYSHYKSKPNFEAYNSMDYSLEQTPYLSGVNVEILYLVRAKDRKHQNRGHIDFWNQLVSSSGGRISRVKTVN